jgi:hypothetical protein
MKLSEENKFTIKAFIAIIIGSLIGALLYTIIF